MTLPKIPVYTISMHISVRGVHNTYMHFLGQLQVPYTSCLKISYLVCVIGTFAQESVLKNACRYLYLYLTATLLTLQPQVVALSATERETLQNALGVKSDMELVEVIAQKPLYDIGSSSQLKLSSGTVISLCTPCVCTQWCTHAKFALLLNLIRCEGTVLPSCATTPSTRSVVFMREVVVCQSSGSCRPCPHFTPRLSLWGWPSSISGCLPYSDIPPIMRGCLSIVPNTLSSNR